MENKTQQKEQISQKTYFQKKKHKNKSHKKEQSNFKWDIEKTSRDINIPITKSDLMTILDAVDPDELLMTSLVKQSKIIKVLTTTTTKKNTIDTDDFIDPIIEPATIVKIDLTQTCPICSKPIKEIMYALHDYDHDSLAHFDCVYKKVTTSVKEKLITNRYLAYLGSGSFGIMESDKDKKIQLIEKIYPGAPLEELLHGEDQQQLLDEEL